MADFVDNDTQAARADAAPVLHVQLSWADESDSDDALPPGFAALQQGMEVDAPGAVETGTVAVAVAAAVEAAAPAPAAGPVAPTRAEQLVAQLAALKAELCTVAETEAAAAAHAIDEAGAVLKQREEAVTTLEEGAGEFRRLLRDAEFYAQEAKDSVESAGRWRNELRDSLRQAEASLAQRQTLMEQRQRDVATLVFQNDILQTALTQAKDNVAKADMAVSTLITEHVRRCLLLAGKPVDGLVNGTPVLDCASCMEPTIEFTRFKCDKCPDAICAVCLGARRTALEADSTVLETMQTKVCACPSQPLTVFYPVLERNAHVADVAEGLAALDRIKARHEIHVGKLAAVKAAQEQAREYMAKGLYSAAIDVINARAPGAAAGEQAGVLRASGTGFVCQCPKCSAGLIATTDEGTCMHATCSTCDTSFCGCCGTTHGEASVTYAMVSTCALSVNFGSYHHSNAQKQLQAGVMVCMEAQRALAQIPGVAEMRPLTNLQPLREAAAHAGLVVVQPGDPEFFYSGINAAPVLLPRGLKFPHGFDWFAADEAWPNNQSVLRIVLTGAELAVGTDVAAHFPQFNPNGDLPDFSVTGLMAPVGANSVVDMSPYAIATRSYDSLELQALLMAMFRPSSFTPFGSTVKADLLNAKRALYAAAYLRGDAVLDYGPMQSTFLRMRMFAFRIAGDCHDTRFPLSVLLRLSDVCWPTTVFERGYLLACVLRKSSPLVTDFEWDDNANAKLISMHAFCRIQPQKDVMGHKWVMATGREPGWERQCAIFRAFCKGITVVFDPAAYLAHMFNTRQIMDPANIATDAPVELAIISDMHAEYRDYILGERGVQQYAAFLRSMAPTPAPQPAGRKGAVKAARLTSARRTDDDDDAPERKTRRKDDQES